MKNILKIELTRALKSKTMLLSLIIGTLITLSHVLIYIIPVSNFIDQALSYNKAMYSVPSVFAGWIGNAGYSMQSFLFYMLLPILVTIPFGDSFFADNKSGYIKNVLIRVKKKKYYLSKYIATFISGGLVIVIPLLINLIVSSMFLPSHLPQVISGYPIGAASMWSKIFYTHPYVYIFSYLLIDFIFSGLIATIALSISLISEYRFSVVFMPFLIYLFIYSILSSLGLSKFVPFYFLQFGYGMSSFITIVIQGLILAAITSTTFLIKGVKEDIY